MLPERSSTDLNIFPLMVVLLLISMLISLYAQAQGRKKLPPGPTPWPIVGNLLAFRADMRHKVLQKLASKFGGLMHIRLGSQRCIVVSTAAVAKELFQANDRVFLARSKTQAFNVISDNYSDLITAVDTQYWHQVRKFCTNRLFSPTSIASNQGIRAEEIHHVMKCIVEASKKGKAISINGWAFQASLNVVTRMLINKRYYKDGLNENEDNVHVMLNGISDIAGAFNISDCMPYLDFITKLQGCESKLKEFRNFMGTVGEKVFDIQNHKTCAQNGKATAESYIQDFVDELFAAQLQDGKPLPVEHITLILLNLLEGGTETISNPVEWAMAELMQRPNLLKQAKDELDAVVGSDRLVQESHISNLPFLQAIIKETLRMHPSIPLVPRESHEPCQILGFTVPAETKMILNIYAIHRDPNFYKDPDEFDPQRFLDHPEVNHMSGFDHFELIPFGGGRRMCPAFRIGNTMVSFLVANLIHSFDWSLPQGSQTDDGNLDMSESFGLAVMRKKHPLHLTAHPRSPAFLY